MINETSTYEDPISEDLQRLDELVNFTGVPTEFWNSYLKFMHGVIDAELGILVLRRADDEAWKRIGLYPPSGPDSRALRSVQNHVEPLATDCAIGGFLIRTGKILGLPKTSDYTIAVRLATGEAKDVCVAVFLLSNYAEAVANEFVVRLRLVANLAVSYQFSRIVRKAQEDVQNFSAVLDLMVLLNAEKRYVATCMTFCNELAARYNSDRVSLGWLKDGYVRLQVISHIEKFNKKMDAVKHLEIAMEEALDQDIEIVFPAEIDSASICRDHQAFAREQDVKYMCSLPMRVEGKPVAVVTCERNTEPFSESDVHYLRLYCDQSIRLLDDLHKRDKWFGARWYNSTTEKLGKLVGVEHTWPKVAAIIGFTLLAFLCFGKLTYRVEAPFTVNSEDIAFLPAPFDGYIDEVYVKPGEEVAEGTVLLQFDTRDLLLEQATALAEKNRYVREMEKARAEKALSDMRVREALVEQTEIRLKLIDHRLSQASIKAPFDGLIVEGDLKERIGAPVEMGEVLFRIAKLENLYLEIKVDETDIHEVQVGSVGQAAFAGQPKIKFPIATDRIEPSAKAEEEGNKFIIRCNFTDGKETWWRPGMTGVAKIDIGKRNVLWIFTHKTINFLRIFFWW